VIRHVDPGSADWGNVEELLASLIEVIDATSWRAVMPHAKANWKPPKPLSIPRPGAPKPDAKGMSMHKFRQLLGQNVTVVSEGEEVSDA